MEAQVIDRMEGLINQKSKQRFIELIDEIMDDLMEEGFDELDVATYLSGIIAERLVGF
jgi:hypothetical protein